jgi:hypothetical protein
VRFGSRGERGGQLSVGTSRLSIPARFFSVIGRG